MPCKNGVCTLDDRRNQGYANVTPQQNKSTGQKIKEFFVGKDPSIQTFPTVTPDVRNLLQQMSSQLGGQLPGLISGQNQRDYNQFAPQQYNFAPAAQEARTNFMQQTIPGLAERFNALGAFGGSGFRNAALNQAQLLEQNLASQQAKYDFLGNQQNIDNYFRGQSLGQQDRAMLGSLLGQLLGTPQIGHFGTQGQTGMLQGIAPYALRAGTGYALGGPAGASAALLGSYYNEAGKQLAGGY